MNRSDIQKKAIDHGFKYWRAPDAHGVDGTVQQAIRLLQDLIGVEVGIGGDEDRGCPECRDMSEAIGDLSIEAMRDHDEIRRLRISQLRRMAHVAMYGECGSIRDFDRWRRFADACLAEIERLRGEG